MVIFVRKVVKLFHIIITYVHNVTNERIKLPNCSKTGNDLVQPHVSETKMVPGGQGRISIRDIRLST